MKPIQLPRPQEVVPGAVFHHRGSTVEILEGKHGDGDLQVRVNGRPISHQQVAVLLMALYMAEERYVAKGKKGGDYFLLHVDVWIYWIRSQLGKAPSPLYPRRDLPEQK